MQVFSDDRLLFEAPLTSADAPAPYLVLPHPDIERALVDTTLATGRVEVRYRAHVEALIEEAGRVRGARIAGETGADEVTAKIVVGADGSSSSVRAALGIPLDCVPYEHSFFIVDVDRPADYEDAMRVELHPAGGVLFVPQKQDRVGLGVLVRPEDEALFRGPDMAGKLAAIGRRSSLLRDRRAFSGSHLYKLWRAHAPRYSARGAVLLGDAIHVTNPTAGQGMTMAIEDAAALARHLGPALLERASPERLDRSLAAYERERRRSNDIQIRLSHWMSRFYALGGPLGDATQRTVFAFGASGLGKAVHRSLWSRLATRSVA
jgi:2-polyprenyl-6-methoxyphenol hydroxylase-like FAD-dependent oxidoreductase